jgi:hypothetical protein
MPRDVYTPRGYFDTSPPSPVATATDTAADLESVPSPTSRTEVDMLVEALKSLPTKQLAALLQAVQPASSNTNTTTNTEPAPPKSDTSSPLASVHVSLVGGYHNFAKKIAFCGVPNLEWTGLQSLVNDPTKALYPLTPSCHRDLSMKHAATAFATRTAFQASVGKIGKRRRDVYMG